MFCRINIISCLTYMAILLFTPMAVQAQALKTESLEEYNTRMQ